MKLAIIVPVHNGGENFRHCLESVTASTRRPDELIVVDDASTDDSAMIARDFGARVLSVSDSPRGPAFARNRGAAMATGDVLVFFDADVAVHPDTLARIGNYLRDHPDLAALFGSYDDAPPARGLVTRYKNLLHHYVHQHSARQATTFWAGCGAIRRQVFAAFGGFDESYTCASIEDIELGSRLARAGQPVWLCADVQVRHLKRWTLLDLLRSDIFDRAIPWTRLILHEKNLPRDLNLNVRSRVSALGAWIGLIALTLGFWNPVGWAVAGIALAVIAGLNADLYGFFARRGGIFFALGAIGLHALYLLYSSLVFGSIMLWTRMTDSCNLMLSPPF